MKFFAYLNAYSQGLSGGDACFLNVAQHLGSQNELTIVTSKLGKLLCQSRGIRANFVLTSTEDNFGGVIQTYMKRTLVALLNPPKGECVLYSTSDFLPDVLPAYLFKLTHPKRLWVQKIFHLIPQDRPLVSLFQKISLFLIKHSADLVIVDNSALKSALVSRFSISNDKIHVITPGLDLKEINKALPSETKSDGIFVGQLRKSKGIYDLVKIWKSVVSKNPKATLLIVGKDVQGNEKLLSDLISQELLGQNIKILGFVEKNSQIYSLMKSSRIFLLPSYEEGFGMVALEALACGLPVVSYDLPALRENFGRSLNYIPPGDTNKFTLRVSEYLRRTSSAKLNYDRTIEKFDTITLVNQEINLIKNAQKSLS